MQLVMVLIILVAISHFQTQARLVEHHNISTGMLLITMVVISHFQTQARLVEHQQLPLVLALEIEQVVL